MTILLAFAFISGVVTILSPCILPVLPIVLSGGVGQGRARPYGVLVGFIGSFTLFTLTLTAIVQSLGIPVDALRYIAVGMIAILGLVMLVPALRDRFELLVSRITSRSGKGQGMPPANTGEKEIRAAGFFRGLPVGVSLGLVWTPCVGPIMASVISLALTQQVTGGAVFITLAYTIGTAIPMIAIMLGGKALLTKVPGIRRHAPTIQRVFGILMIVVAVAIGFGWDRRFQSAVLTALPGYGAGLTSLEDTQAVRVALDSLDGAGGTSGGTGDGTVRSISASQQPENGELADYGQAPKLVAEGPWFNTEGLAPTGPSGAAATDTMEMGSVPLTMEDLRGKVVLVDFWTYSCVNCVRTIPYLQSWYETYKDEGFVILGVHTPEFEFEKNSNNVRKAMEDLGVTWPVVQDNSYAQWRAYNNRFWPAHYFIDATGIVRYYSFGEGHYDTSEKVIRELLAEAGATNLSRVGAIPSEGYYARTPETYLGYGRQESLKVRGGVMQNSAADYQPAAALENGEWTLDGRWNVSREYVVPASSGVLELGFNAKNVFLVIEPESEGRIRVTVDGDVSRDTDDVTDGVLQPDESRLYQLVGLRRAGEHVLRLEVEGDLRLFAFTFG